MGDTARGTSGGGAGAGAGPLAAPGRRVLGGGGVLGPSRAASGAAAPPRPHVRAPPAGACGSRLPPPAGLPGRQAEALARLPAKPGIRSQCKQRVILSLPPPRVALTHLTLEGTGVGGACVGIFNLVFHVRGATRSLGCAEGRRGARGAGRGAASPPWHRRPHGPRAAAPTKWPPGRRSVWKRAGSAEKMAAGALMSQAARPPAAASGASPGLQASARAPRPRGLAAGLGRTPLAQAEAAVGPAAPPCPPARGAHECPAGPAARPRSRRGREQAGWEEKRNFSLKVIPKQVGWGPSGRRRQGRGRWKVWSRLEERGGSGRTRRGRPGRGPASSGSPWPWPPASRPRRLVQISPGTDEGRERLASCIFRLICPNGPWRSGPQGV